MKDKSNKKLIGAWSSIVLALVLAGPSYGASIIVDSPVDNITGGDGLCTLREAIINANTDSDATGGDCVAGDGVDAIVLAATTYTLSLSGTDEDAAADGDLDIIDIDNTGSLSIVGVADPISGEPLTIIDGNSAVTGERIFDIFNPAEKTNFDTPFTGVTVSLQNLKLINGIANEENGGAINSWRFNDLNITNCVFENNQAIWGLNVDDPGTLDVDERTLSGHGGAIYSRGNLNITNSRFDGNQAYTEYDANSDGIIEGEDEKSGNGGGVFTSFTSTITTSTFSNNIASNGGGLNGTGGFDVTITNSIFNDNWAVMGGGINNISPSNRVFVENSTVSGNNATDMGAGINSDGAVSLRHVTVANNHVIGSDNKGVGINYFGPAGSFTLANTLLANNLGKSVEVNCGCTGGTEVACTILDVDTDGGNFSSDFTCALDTLQGDLIGADPQLLPLADNGGPTNTHAVAYNSVVIDAGLSGNCLSADQRSVSRPQDGDADGTAACDIGAYERQMVSTDLLINQITPNIAGIKLGDQVTFSVVVSNTGPASISDVELELMLSSEVTFVSATSSVGNCTANSSTVTCALGDLVIGDSLSIDLVVLATGLGDASVSGIVSAREIDSDSSNNSLTADFTIIPVPVSSSSRSNGGLCSYKPDAVFDPVLPFTVGIAIILLIIRRQRQVICDTEDR